MSLTERKLKRYVSTDTTFLRNSTGIRDQNMSNGIILYNNGGVVDATTVNANIGKFNDTITVTNYVKAGSVVCDNLVANNITNVNNNTLDVEEVWITMYPESTQTAIDEDGNIVLVDNRGWRVRQGDDGKYYAYDPDNKVWVDADMSAPTMSGIEIKLGTKGALDSATVNRLAYNLVTEQWQHVDKNDISHNIPKMTNDFTMLRPVHYKAGSAVEDLDVHKLFSYDQSTNTMYRVNNVDIIQEDAKYQNVMRQQVAKYISSLDIHTSKYNSFTITMSLTLDTINPRTISIVEPLLIYNVSGMVLIDNTWIHMDNFNTNISQVDNTITLTANDPRVSDCRLTLIINDTTPDISLIVPTISVYPTVSNIVYGQSLKDSIIISSGVASVSGVFEWDKKTLIPDVGTSQQSMIFIPNDLTRYDTLLFTIDITVDKADPIISVYPTASNIVYGQSLAQSTLSGSVNGTFTWADPSIKPPIGTSKQTVVFTPIDIYRYNVIELDIDIVVDKITPTLSSIYATDIVYGQSLKDSIITVVAKDSSTLLTGDITVDEIYPTAGDKKYTAVFTPTNTGLYNSVEFEFNITINQAEPSVITLPTASSITLGKTLASSQLINGEMNVVGTFTWADPSIKPPIGTSTQHVLFRPTDIHNYVIVSLYVDIVVN